MRPEIVTIGVYGFTAERFFAKLRAAGIDTFCDIRQRRGVRGAQYAFANSVRLQARLAELGIRYLHLKELAPTSEVRRRQEEADKASKVPRRQRSQLSDGFVQAYREEILDDYRPETFLGALPEDARVVALFCVEGEPAACHRSLVAAKLHQELGLEVSHLLP